MPTKKTPGPAHMALLRNSTSYGRNIINSTYTLEEKKTLNIFMNTEYPSTKTRQTFQKKTTRKSNITHDHRKY